MTSAAPGASGAKVTMSGNPWAVSQVFQPFEVKA